MFDTQIINSEVSLRVVSPDDSEILVEAYLRNREHLAPWEPLRSDEFYTEPFQRADIQQRLEANARDESIPLILASHDKVVGRFNIGGVSRGPFQSAGLGYWVDKDYLGQGLASAAVRAIVTQARDRLGLHRLEASTLVHNTASQRVLTNNGFVQIGMAPQYLQIAGHWQDHNLYQVILHG